MKDYHINIFYTDEDGGYIADILDLAGCSAFGESAEAALAELTIAKDAWLKASKQRKQKIPKLHYRPVMYQLSQPLI